MGTILIVGCLLLTVFVGIVFFRRMKSIGSLAIRTMVMGIRGSITLYDQCQNGDEWGWDLEEKKLVIRRNYFVVYGPKGCTGSRWARALKPDSHEHVQLGAYCVRRYSACIVLSKL